MDKGDRDIAYMLYKNLYLALEHKMYNRKCNTLIWRGGGLIAHRVVELQLSGESGSRRIACEKKKIVYKSMNGNLYSFEP